MCVYVYIKPFYPAMTQSKCLMTIGRESDLSSWCYSCRFACQQGVLKTFPGHAISTPRMR